MRSALGLYEKMANVYVEPTIMKYREDIDTDFLIIMNRDLTVSYFSGSAKDILHYIIESGSCKIESIFDKIFEVYDVSKEELQTDIIDFIRDLQWKNIVKLTFK